MSSNNNYRGSGGASGSGGHNSYRGRGGRSGGSRHHHSGAGGNNSPQVLPAKFRPCKTWLKSGQCPNGSTCRYAHIVQLHATVEASNIVQRDNKNQQHHNNYQQQQQQQRAAVSSIALWQHTDGSLKIFSGSHDGYWRLWNASNNFMREVEYLVGNKVECLHVVNHFLFCGMEAQARGFSIAGGCSVGMLHAWNLQSAHSPPLELHVDPPFLPYAHNQAVTSVTVSDTTVVTGSQDGSIRVWKFSNNAFVLVQSLPGHARQVTGLILVDTSANVSGASSAPTPSTSSPTILWSASTDGSIRIWNLTSGKCQFSITKDDGPPNAANPQQQPSQPSSQQHLQNGQGHSHAVTALQSFSSPQGHFCLSASLDTTIKAWNATTGECVATESHGEGVVSMTLATEPSPRQAQLLLVGLESGNIVCRNLIPQGAKTPAFAVLFVLTQVFNTSHVGAVHCLQAGPQSTFYSGGSDGKMMVWQINGDLGLT